MSGPRAELLATGQLGPEGVALLYRTVRQVVRLRNLPPPPGIQQWTDEALTEAAHDVFATRGPERLLLLASRSTDEGSFRAQLWQTVANDLASGSRRTERGRLSERVKDVLPHVPAVEHHGNTVRLADVDPTQPEPRFDELVNAASSVAIQVPAWDPNSDRNPPLAARESLVEALTAVLALAPNGLNHGVLVSVLAVRLGVHDAAEQMDTAALDAVIPPTRDDPGTVVAERDAGARLLDELTTSEQLVLPYLDESTAVIAEHSGLGRTKAWQTANSARLKLADLLDGDPSAAATLREAASQARSRWGLR